MINKSRIYFIKTFGCQANEVDSEQIAGFLDQAGLKKTDRSEEADLVVINSCSVRQSAEDRAIGLAHNLSQKKIKPIIIITGCILYHDQKYLDQKFKNRVDYFVKTVDWPKFISRSWSVVVDDSPASIKLADFGIAYISIMEGCNNFCSYCVVPYARGRERSSPSKAVVCQVRKAVRGGYKKILLLGQNVNSYGKDLGESQLKFLNLKKFKTPFAALLDFVSKISEVEKVSFLTSNPQDLNDEIIKALRLPKIDRQLHLPIQSGDDRILKKMNRQYSSLQYIKLVEKIKKSIPDIMISTDIIVGFPGETEKQFQNTVRLCQRIGFSKAYVNKYSPRPKTLAGRKFIDNVPWAEKKRRWHILNQLINQ